MIVIAGPTASGKSALALDVAQEIGGEIINADSMQIYKDTPILSACPSLDDKKLIPHHLYEIYDSNVHGNVVEWLNLAVAKIVEIWSRNKIPVVVGGTGLYINNLIEGTTPIPAISPEIRTKVAAIENPYHCLDDMAKASIEPNDKTRSARALEVLLQTKESIVEWHQKPLKKMIEAKFLVVKILPPKKELDARCDMRFDNMIANGALNEVKNFKALNINPNFPAAKALGLPELINATNFDEAISLAKVHSHQYAKRQITWFKNKLNANLVINECYQKKYVKNIIELANNEIRK